MTVTELNSENSSSVSLGSVHYELGQNKNDTNYNTHSHNQTHDSYYPNDKKDDNGGNGDKDKEASFAYDLELHGLDTQNSNGDEASVTIRSDEYQELDGKDENTRLKKDLKARHISMIAIGGSLGTGLLIGTGTALRTAGPASILIAYGFVGILVFFTMAALGEMAAYIPLDGFTSYATRYCDPALGFAVGYSYLFKYFIITPNQLTAAALVIQYWVSRETVNPGVWITIFLVVIVAINTVGVKYFGEFEFWLSSFKVMVMIGVIIFLFVIMLGGGPNHDRLGFRYWKDPGAFKPYASGVVSIAGSTGKFVAFVNVFVYALFAYLGIELTGIVAGEAENPRRNIPRAVKLTVWRILFFYIVTIFLLGMCVAYDDPRLIAAAKAKTSAAASPFVVAIQNSGVEVLPHIFNVCVLLFVFSACNSDLYVGTRSLYGLAIDGKAPKLFAKTNRWGVPYNAMGCCILFCLLAYMNVSSGSAEIFNYFVNVVSIFGILSWISILITYIFFDRAVRAQGIDRSSFSYVAPFQPYGSYFTLAFCVLLAFIKNFSVFLGNQFDYKTFITGYIGLPVYAFSYIGYKLYYKTKFVKPMEADLYSYKGPIDREEEEGKIMEAERKERLKNGKKDLEWFYEKFFASIF